MLIRVCQRCNHILYGECSFKYLLESIRSSKIYMWPKLCIKQNRDSMHWGLVMPYGITELDQHWIRRWLITWSIRHLTLRTNLNELWIKIQQFSFKVSGQKKTSVKYQLFSSGLCMFIGEDFVYSSDSHVAVELSFVWYRWINFHYIADKYNWIFHKARQCQI